MKNTNIIIPQWFDKMMNTFTDEKMSKNILACLYYNDYESYSNNYIFFTQSQFEDIKNNYQKYISAIFKEYEVDKNLTQKNYFG